MGKAWIIDIGGGQYSTVIANHTPVGAVIEAPIDPDTGLPYPVEFVTVQDSTDERGNPVKVATVDYAAADLKKVEDEVEDEIKKADSLLQPFDQKRKDLMSQSRAFLRYVEGDSTMLNDMSQAIRFIEFSEYERGKKMDENTYFAIVRSAPGEFQIQEFPLNQRPSNLLAVAPAGFKPGDEEFLTERQGGGFDIDWDGRLAKFNSLEKSADEQRKTDKWNTESPLERIKNAFISGN